MKKVYLHGALGKRFGKTWDLNVSSPGEAIAAIFANNPEVEKYLNKKQQEGVVYGIKKSGEQSFAGNKEFLLSTEKDLHVFPIAQGSGGFAVSLVMTAITTAASMYVSKKISEALKQDDSVLKTQTKSYIYSGQQNRFEQGNTIPVGYGKMKIGSNNISACNINYEYNSEFNKIFNFSNGLYSIVPEYSEYYRVDLGPLISSFALNVFDGSSKSSFVDPAYQYISEISSETPFGAIDGMYGGFEPIEKQRERFVIKEGNEIGGYLYYTYNFAKGVEKARLANFNSDIGPLGGNWWPNAEAENVEGARYRMTEANALSTSYVCTQSVPLKENSQSSKHFYPISFIEENLDFLKDPADQFSIDNGGVTVKPIPVGERWRGGNKHNGVGWFKLESVAISKSLELISEGPIDGFADQGGNKLIFNKDSKANSSITPIRYDKDDYLQAVYLDNTPVKEVNHELEIDSYNVNEFDIDVGLNDQGELGAEDQKLMEPQYNFTAHTKEINRQLFGPKAVNSEVLENLIEPDDFNGELSYKAGDIVKYEGVLYKIQIDYGNDYDSKKSYKSGDIIRYNNLLYIAEQEIENYEQFDPEKEYKAGDKIKEITYNGEIVYYEVNSDFTKVIGKFDEYEEYQDTHAASFIVGNYFFVGDGSTSSVYKIDDLSEWKQVPVTDEDGAIIVDETTGEIQYEPSDGPGGDIETIAKKLSVPNPDLEKSIIDNKPVYILINNEESSSDFNIQEKNSKPDGSFWSQIIVNSPDSITKNGEELDIDLNFIFLKTTNEDLDLIAQKRTEEENYISHTIINPLVSQAYITLKIEELAYIYQGDEVEVHYEIGDFWNFVAAGLATYYTIQAFSAAATATAYAGAITLANTPPFPNPGASVSAYLGSKDSLGDVAEAAAHALVWGAVFLALSVSDKFKIGTKIENSGELWPNRARFRIKYGNEGEVPYYTDIFIYGIATSAYKKDVKIYLPPNPNQKDRVIKVYKLNRERNPIREGEQAARYKEKMSLASITEITPVQLNYPNSVIIGTRINAKDSPNMPERTYNMRLKKVQVPTNYDPETRKYEGNWSGDFSPDLKWTDNPAWCLYDLISNKRFGVGKFGIKEENIDRWTLYKIAKYCDEYVPSGYSPKYKKRKLIKDGFSGDKPQFKIEGIDSNESFNSEFNYSGKQLAIFYKDSTYDSIKIHSVNKSNRTIVLEYEPEPQEFECAVQIDYPLVEPRYTLNAYIMNQENAFKLINEFAAIFRSFAYWSGGAINFFQDEKKESVMLFSNNNISEEGFSYSSTPKTSRTNSCNIKYVDRYNMYRPKIERAEDREAVKENNMIEQSIDGFGITSQAQAKRAAEFVVKSANLETEILSFKTSMLGSYLKPGDVIDVLDNKRTIGRFAGKALDIKVDEQGRNAEVLADYPIHSFIDPYDKETWKNVTLYAPSGNETIASLDSDTDVTDEKIDSMRATQVGDYLVYDIAEDDRTMKLYNNIYEFVEGDFTWLEALRDAKTRSGQMAVIEDDVAQDLMSIVLPKDKTAWLGGYNREKPDPEALLWVGSSSCGDNFIEYENGWAEGFPKFTDPLLTDREDEDENIVTDLPKKPWNVSADNPSKLGNFIFASGSQDLEKHGKWMHMSGHLKSNYILQKTFVEDDYLKKLKDSDGTTFMMEDSVNFAEKKQYKVINITEDSDGLFSIQALQYNVDKFDNIEKDLSIRPPHHPVIFNEGGSYNE